MRHLKIYLGCDSLQRFNFRLTGLGEKKIVFFAQVEQNIFYGRKKLFIQELPYCIFFLISETLFKLKFHGELCKRDNLQYLFIDPSWTILSAVGFLMCLSIFFSFKQQLQDIAYGQRRLTCLPLWGLFIGLTETCDSMSRSLFNVQRLVSASVCPRCGHNLRPL